MKRVLWTCVLAYVAATASAGGEPSQGMLKTDDGVEIHYVKQGGGAQTVILPGRLFALDEFRWLAERYTLISYDMRNRGRSARVEDPSKISLEADVADLEAVRRRFGVERFHVVGYSYLGLMVALYAMEHPTRIDRMVQIGPVPLKFGVEYKPEYVAGDLQRVIAEHGGPRLRELREQNYHATHPREYCEEEWRVLRFMLVGDAAQVDRMGAGVCDMPNEWPVNLARHLELHFVGSVQKLDVPRERVSRMQTPVLVVHGTRDRNAPYGAGREWAHLLPNARLLTIEGAAHQTFAERPDVVRPAVAAFLAGNWPEGAEKVTADPRK